MSFITESVMEVEAIRVSAAVTARKEEGPGVGIPTTLKAVRRGNLAHGRWGALSGGGSACVAGGGCHGEVGQGDDDSSWGSSEPSV